MIQYLDKYNMWYDTIFADSQKNIPWSDWEKYINIDDVIYTIKDDSYTWTQKGIMIGLLSYECDRVYKNLGIIQARNDILFDHDKLKYCRKNHPEFIDYYNKLIDCIQSIEN